MRITAIHERSVSIGSTIRNAYIDFSKMTVSVVALVTDVIRDGRPVVGYGFNSNGRYAPSLPAAGAVHPALARSRRRGSARR